MSYNYSGVERTAEFDRWLIGLPRTARYTVEIRIRRLVVGHARDVRSVGDGVFELRIHQGPGYRVYFCRWRHGIALLLCGGDKSSQPRDILRAQCLRKALPWQ